MLPLLTLRRSAYQGVTLRRLATTVRVIVREEIPSAYPGAVIAVRPGYARNYLIPQKKAVYATRQNFALLGMKDPDHETAAEKQERLAREALKKDDQDLMAADLLRHYLRNKVVCMTLYFLSYTFSAFLREWFLLRSSKSGAMWTR